MIIILLVVTRGLLLAVLVERLAEGALMKSEFGKHKLMKKNLRVRVLSSFVFQTSYHRDMVDISQIVVQSDTPIIPYT